MKKDLKDSALLVIDMQKGLFKKKIPIYRDRELLNNINALIDSFHSSGKPVFFIQHIGVGLIEGTQNWQLHDELKHKQGYFLQKRQGSAFKDTILKEELGRLGIKCVVVTGLVTHGCVKAACIDGKKLGYEVVLIADGHSSYNENAGSLINEWNGKLAGEGIEVIPAGELISV
jgi:nicotinamidase-related amidase